jgi:HSP20 family protein
MQGEKQMAKSDTNEAQGQTDQEQGNRRQQTAQRSGAMQSRGQGGQGGQGRGLARRGGGSASLFSLDPRDLLTATPFELMRRFSEEMDRMFEDFGLSAQGTGRGQAGGGSDVATWTPAIEVFQRENDLVVRAELPGVDNGDVRVIVTDDGLIIEGERREQNEERGEGFYRSERVYGRFYRVIPLPEDVDTDQVRAQFNNGVLEITVPVPQRQERRREIPIGSEGASGGASRTTGSEGGDQSQAASATQMQT